MEVYYTLRNLPGSAAQRRWGVSPHIQSSGGKMPRSFKACLRELKLRGQVSTVHRGGSRTAPTKKVVLAGRLRYVGRAQVAEALEATEGDQAAFESLRQRW